MNVLKEELFAHQREMKELLHKIKDTAPSARKYLVEQLDKVNARIDETQREIQHLKSVV